MGGFNGSGTYVRYYNWTQDAANGIDITASRFDTEDGGYATGLSNCITRDGQGVPTANISWNGFKITNLLNPVSAQDGATKNYVDLSAPWNIQTTAESNAGVTPTNVGDLPGNKPSGDVSRYGALQDGSTDDTAAMVKACAVGGDITISGPMVLASASLAALTNNALALKSGTTVRWVNGGSITITGTTGCNLFWSINPSNITILNPNVTGNGSSATSSTGYIWYVQGTSGATGNMVNLHYLGGSASNFGGFYWIYFDNTAGTTYYMQNLRVVGANFTSKTGNAQGPTSTTIPANMIGFSGSDTVSYTGIRDVFVLDNHADGTFVKTFAVAWSGVYRAKFSRNTLNNFGTDGGFNDDTNCYALFAYDHSHGSALQPDLIDISGNTIDGVRDCGVYCAGADRITVSNNSISGQTSTADSILPKGAIALNQPTFGTLEGNTLSGNAFSMSLVVGSGDVIHAKNTTINGIPNSDIGVKVAPTGTGTVGDVVIDGIKIDTPGTSTVGIRVDSNSTIGLGNFVLRNFHLNTPYTGILQYSNDSTVPAIGTVHISNGEIANASNVGLQFSNCSGATSRIVLEEIVFNSPVAGCSVFVINSSINLTIRAITFNDMASGSSFCWNGTGAKGRVEGVRFNNVAVARRYASSGDLGVALPSGWGATNDFVQNLSTTELGSTSSKYVILGWTYDSTNSVWLPCRSLTGN